jgi:hypothetical protein
MAATGEREGGLHAMWVEVPDVRPTFRRPRSWTPILRAHLESGPLSEVRWRTFFAAKPVKAVVSGPQLKARWRCSNYSPDRKTTNMRDKIETTVVVHTEDRLTTCTTWFGKNDGIALQRIGTNE